MYVTMIFSHDHVLVTSCLVTVFGHELFGYGHELFGYGHELFSHGYDHGHEIFSELVTVTAMVAVMITAAMRHICRF